MEAITREEKIISGENLTPITRKEMFLAKAAGQNIETPEPITREEMFLSKISGGGTSHEPNIQPLTVIENGTYAAPDGVDGYSPVSVEIESAGGTDERFKQLVEGTITEAIDDTLTSVKDYAFYKCGNLTRVDFPLATIVGSYAFYHCAALIDANFENATSIANYGFYNCGKLINVNFPNAASIGKTAFENCGNLVSVKFPMVTNIGNGAFTRCIKLTTADFPIATNIETLAFYNCNQFKTLVLRSETLCSLASGSTFTATKFAPNQSGGTIIAPRALVTEYPNATNWSAMISQNPNNRVLALEDYTVDGTITGEIDWDKLNAVE